MRRPLNFHSSKKSKFHKVYWRLCKRLNNKGIKVTHKNMRNFFGLCRYLDNEIIMHSKISGTKAGLIHLLHEYRHLQHAKTGKYFAYYYPSIKLPTLSIIHRAEWDCFKFAQKTLKRLGYKANEKHLNKRWAKKHFLPLYSLEDI